MSLQISLPIARGWWRKTGIRAPRPLAQALTAIGSQLHRLVAAEARGGAILAGRCSLLWRATEVPSCIVVPAILSRYFYRGTTSIPALLSWHLYAGRTLAELDAEGQASPGRPITSWPQAVRSCLPSHAPCRSSTSPR